MPSHVLDSVSVHSDLEGALFPKFPPNEVEVLKRVILSFDRPVRFQVGGLFSININCSGTISTDEELGQSQPLGPTLLDGMLGISRKPLSGERRTAT